MGTIDQDLCNAIDIIVQKRISSLEFNRAIVGKVLEKTNVTLGEYTIKYQDSVFVAYSLGEGSYESGDVVYVLIPNNNFNNKKLILNYVSKTKNNPTETETFKAALVNGWVHYGGWSDLGYWKDRSGSVHISGAIKSGTVGANILIFTLPPGFRPAKPEIFSVSAGGVYQQRVDITPNGEVRFQSPMLATTGAWCSFSGISFKAGSSEGGGEPVSP